MILALDHDSVHRRTNTGHGVMAQKASDIPVLSSDVIVDLPLYYRVLAEYLSETGRIVIVNSEKQSQNSA
jgi:hypothetical protein